jgi:hypothetical protein
MKTNKKYGVNCSKATDNKNWGSSVDTSCSSLEGNNFITGKEGMSTIGSNYEELASRQLSDIQNIQELEKNLYDKINTGSLSQNQQQEILRLQCGTYEN